jgi:hypothetical protein
LTPDGSLDVLGPGVGEDAFEVLELEEVSEDDLVPQDGLAVDDERQGEADGVVELERFVT